METVPAAPLRTILGGVGAGLVLGVADWGASGLLATPATLIAATLIGGALAGGLAGALAATVRKPALGPALVLAGGIGLEGLSTASKELAEARGVGLAVALLVALAALFLAAPTRRPPPRAAVLAALCALPAGAWLAARLAHEPWVHLAGAAAPLLVLIAGRVARAPLVLPATWGAALLVLACAQSDRGLPSRPAPPRERASDVRGPSIVLLVIDTLRADAVEPDGPLAAFARTGVEFRQCVSAAPWTLPALGSLLTGLYPSQHGAVDAATPLADDVSTLAELLHAQGYATAGFTGGAFVGRAHRLDQGFEHFDAGGERRFAAFRTHVPLVWRLAKNRYFPLLFLVRWVDEYRGFAGVVAAAKAWSETRPDRRPFFLFLHTYQAHDYYLYDPPVDDAGPGESAAFSERFAGRLSVHPSELVQASQADLDAFRRRYEGRVAAIGAELPALERWVDELAGGDVVWVVTADHGEGFDGALHRVHHGGRLHEDLLRVPLIVKAPALAAGRVVEEAVRSVDVLPTVLELAGMPAPEGIAGVSLVPALAGGARFPAVAFAEERAHGLDLVAARGAGWKWIRGSDRSELYHLAVDPGELAAAPGEPPAELRAELSAFPTLYPARPRATIELDDATFEHLQALGYVR